MKLKIFDIDLRWNFIKFIHANFFIREILFLLFWIELELSMTDPNKQTESKKNKKNKNKQVQNQNQPKDALSSILSNSLDTSSLLSKFNELLSQEKEIDFEKFDACEKNVRAEMENIQGVLTKIQQNKFEDFPDEEKKGFLFLKYPSLIIIFRTCSQSTQ